MRFRLFLILSAAWSAHAQDFDILLRCGRLIDPRNSRDGRLAAVEQSIDPSRTKKTIDASGLLITPSLIDLHVHVLFTAGNPGAWAGDNSVQPDAFSFRSGVTTMVDVGSHVSKQTIANCFRHCGYALR